jgi:plasmid stability protein
MKAITVRNLPPEVAKAIRAKARKEGLSLNRTVARLLAEATGKGEGGQRKPVLHQDFDRFFGIWSKEEAAEFDEVLREQRHIEPEMWK